MGFEKGKGGNPGGTPKDKPFTEALRMELASVGNNHEKLRAIARKLLDEAEAGKLPAINAVADRLDGKLMQETKVTTRSVPASELSDDELAAIIETRSSDGAIEAPIDKARLN